MQRVIGSTVASVTSLLVGLVVVFLYASFLLLELRHFPAKLAGLSSDPQRVDRVRKVTHDINARIGHQGPPVSGGAGKAILMRGFGGEVRRHIGNHLKPWRGDIREGSERGAVGKGMRLAHETGADQAYSQLTRHATTS